MMDRYFVDVSRYQGPSIDWAAVRKSGIKGAMLRAVSTRKSEGGIYIDPTFERNYRNAKAAGLPVGAYYYMYAQDKATVQAELAKLRQALCGKVFDLPIAIDVEDNRAGEALTADQLTDLVEYAAKTIESWGAYAMVYTYTNYAHTQLNMDRLSAYDLWIADYRGKRPPIAHGMWQFSNHEKVPGIPGNVDMSDVYRDYVSIIRGKGLNDFSHMGAEGELKKYVTGPVSKGDAAELIAWADKKHVKCTEVK